MRFVPQLVCRDRSRPWVHVPGRHVPEHARAAPGEPGTVTVVFRRNGQFKRATAKAGCAESKDAIRRDGNASNRWADHGLVGAATQRLRGKLQSLAQFVLGVVVALDHRPLRWSASGKVSWSACDRRFSQRENTEGHVVCKVPRSRT